MLGRALEKFGVIIVGIILNEPGPIIYRKDTNAINHFYQKLYIGTNFLSKINPSQPRLVGW